MTFSRNPRPFIHGRVFALPSPPKVGAVCLNWARPELCGGRRVTCVPTAIQASRSAEFVKVCGCRPWGPAATRGVGRRRQTCMAETRIAARSGVVLRTIDLVELRAQEPLPETADELCGVAEALGALNRESETV